LGLICLGKTEGQNNLVTANRNVKIFLLTRLIVVYLITRGLRKVKKIQ